MVKTMHETMRALFFSFANIASLRDQQRSLLFNSYNYLKRNREEDEARVSKYGGRESKSAKWRPINNGFIMFATLGVPKAETKSNMAT